MRRWWVLMMVAVLGALAVVPAAAQAEDVLGMFADIPQARTEDGAFVLGDPDAPVTVVVFGDFMCPHCQRYEAQVQTFIDDYVRTGKARLEYRLYAIVHPTYSTYTAQLAECADAQAIGGFWGAYKVLYALAEDSAVGPDSAEVVAERLGISAEKLDTCAETATQYETDRLVGQALGVSGTPSVAFRTSEGALGWASVGTEVFNRGGVPLEVLAEVVEAESPDELILVTRSVLSNLLATEGCVAPCWEGIVPDETAFDEVLPVLRADRQFVEISTQDVPDTGEQVVNWLSLGSGVTEPNAILGGTDGLVDAISVIELAPFTLGNVFGVMGEPDYALVLPSGEAGALFYGFYEARTTIVMAFFDAENGFNALTSVIGGQFLSADVMKDILVNAAPVDWAGFEAVESYIR
jgi:protein-disulfide isomerase